MKAKPVLVLHAAEIKPNFSQQGGGHGGVGGGFEAVGEESTCSRAAGGAHTLSGHYFYPQQLGKLVSQGGQRTTTWLSEKHIAQVSDQY